MKRVLLITAIALAVIPCRAEAPLDVDQLAGRMRKNVAIYQQVRDEALAAYAKLHPGTNAYDKDAREAIHLMAYLSTWGDFYREGLWKIAADDADRATLNDAKDPLLTALPYFSKFAEWKTPFNLMATLPLNNAGVEIAGTDYPAVFKFWCDRISTKNLIAGKTGKTPFAPEYGTLIPAAVQRASADYGEMIKAHLDPDLLFDRGDTFLHDLQPDADSLNAAYTAIDKAFGQSDSTSVVRIAFQGAYWYRYAWNARGIGFADSVTDDMQKTFQERLTKADDILELAYAQHPGAAYISREMLTVELGQGVDADRMDLWFQRAIKASPDDYETYRAKYNYLTPKWYGSDDALWAFGVECAQGQNWASKIPMILVDAIVSDLWKKHPEYFTDPDKWKIIEDTFRGYLAQFPQSNYYRSIFARWAVEGQHWATAEEQFQILGDNWDRMVFPNTRYPDMRGLADKNSAAAK